MRKIILKLDGIKEMLTKEQMKKISGGYGNCGESECSATIACPSKWPICHFTTCLSDNSVFNFCGDS